MPFIGNKPSAVPLTSADITDGIITNADISSTAGITLNKLSGNPSFRNIVINGDMQIAQRNTSVASITTSGYRTVDRFTTLILGLGTWTQSQSTDVPSGYGFTSSLKMDCTTANASPSASDFLMFRQIFEGQNLQYLKKGTANAVSLTLSFWVKSTKTGTFIAELFDNNSRGICASYTVSTTNTWEFKTITFAGDTSGTISNTNGTGLTLNFWLGAGSNFTSGTLNTTWASSINANRAVGQVNIADSTANDWFITGVQLEAGTSATDFEFLPFDVNLNRCFRYYHFLGGESAYQNVNTVAWFGTGDCVGHFRFPVTMRTAPAVSKTGNWATLGGSGTAGVSLGIDQNTTKNCQLGATGGSGGTGGQASTLRANNDTSYRLTFDAEM